MFNIGEIIVYKRDVCEIIDIKKNNINNQNCYVLVPINDESLRIKVPLENKLNNIRSLINKKELDNLIKNIPNIGIIENPNKLIENDYKLLIKEGNHENLIKIIKTAYLRNKERSDNKRKIGDKDDYYFKLAEKYLYSEISVVLNKSFDETKQFIIDEVEKLYEK